MVLAVASMAHATQPPEEQDIELGRDSTGSLWVAHISRGAPVGSRTAALIGPVTVKIPLEPRVEEPRIWALDAKDRIWLVAENGSGWTYDIRMKKLEHFRIPVKQQVVADLVVLGDTLWFQEYHASIGAALSSWSRGDKAVKQACVVKPGLSIDGYALTPAALWVATSATAGPEVGVQVIDPGSGKLVARSDAQAAAGVPATSRPRLSPDGEACWITRPTRGLVERVERSGERKAWDLGGFSPVQLVLTGGRAVVIGRKGSYQQPKGPVPPGVHASWSTTAARVFVLDRARPAASFFDVPEKLRDGSLAVDAKGGVTLDGAPVRLDGDRPKLDVR